MKNLLKLSLITSMLLTSNLFADLNPTERAEIDGMHLTDGNLDEYKLDKVEFYPIRDLAIQNQSRLDTKDVLDNRQDTDITELFSRTSTYTTQSYVDNEISNTNTYIDDSISDFSDEVYEYIDDEIYGNENITTTTNAQGETIETTTDVEGTIYEILNGQTQTVFNVDKNELESETTLKKGLIQLSEENILKDTQQDITITTNKNLSESNGDRLNQKDVIDNRQDADITDLKANDISQQSEIDSNTSNISIERDRNNVQDTQITDNRSSININTSNISSNRNLAQDNNSRLNQKDVIDNRQDADIAELKKDVEEIKKQGLENFLSKVDEEMDKRASVLGALNANHDFTNGDTSVSLNTTSFNGKEAFGASIAVRKENLIFSLSGATDFKGNKALQGKVQVSF